jgi:hypothetical protein
VKTDFHIARCNTAALMRELARKGDPPPTVPSHIGLSLPAQPYWTDIVSARPVEMWRPVELPLVAQAAGLPADLSEMGQQRGPEAVKRRGELLRLVLMLLRALKVCGYRSFRRARLPLVVDADELLAK